MFLSIMTLFSMKQSYLSTGEITPNVSPLIYNISKRVSDALKIWQQMLQGFKSLSDHF